MDKLRVSTRLLILIGLLSALLLPVGSLGLFGIGKSNDALRMVYEDNAVHLVNLGEIRSLMAENRAQLLLGLQHDQAGSFAKLHDHPIDRHLDAVEASVKRISAQWQTFVAISMNHEERALASVRRVSQMVGEISAASVEQSTGVGQVGEAVSQMDQVTQQNAALVEEGAAAAESLKGQAQQLVQAVAVFKLSQTSGHHAEPASSVASAQPREPSPATQMTRAHLAAKSTPATRKQEATESPTAGTETWQSF